MKIQKVETYVLKDKLSKSFFFSQWEYSERCICIVKITASNGEYGWGEGYGPAEVLEAGIKLLEPIVIGKNPMDNEVIWHQMYRKTLDYARRGVLVAAMSSIDIAIWDLKGKILDLPVSALLGGTHRNKIKPYASGLYFSDYDNPAKRFDEEALSYVNRGFKAIKMKVGLGITSDYNNVKNMREILGDGIKLMVDSNHAYTLVEAIELARKIEPFQISWFEEPISPEFYTQYKELREKTIIPIAGGECEYLRFGFHHLLRNQSVDILQPDICACGGLSEAKRIASLASTYGVDIIPHTWGTGIGIHAALHFISNLENIPGRLITPESLIEYDQTDNQLRERLTEPEIIMKDGMIDVPERPGLGVEVNTDALNEFSNSSSLSHKVTD
ncbi:MAG: mandelate racemase/muconate lactonizing enzyme family protein [Bacteroidetes bacterium]|nr:mandelate racemase/muconate lactonizing enzyme family protein [Bacteroidota bacterium]